MMHQAVETAEEEERLSASVTAVVADHCYTSSPTTSTNSINPTTSNNCYSTSNQSYAKQTPKQSHRVHSRLASNRSFISQSIISKNHGYF